MEQMTECTNRESTYPLGLFKAQIIDFSQHELKNCQYLVTFMEQFLAKQKIKSYFACEDFCQETKRAYNQIQSYLSQLSVNLTNFPCLGIFMKIFQLIFLQINKLLTYSNERWAQEIKTLTLALNSQEQKFQPPMEVCVRCSENIKHQQLKQTKQQIYTFMFDDPYCFFQCNKASEINGEQTSHKKLQDKLSELANGVEIGQRYIKQLLEQFDLQEKAVQSSMNSLGINSESQYILPVMPMLRSVFKHAKGNKKQIRQASAQTDTSYKKNEDQNTIIQKQLKDLGSEKQKIISKFATEISDKTIQIQNLAQKINEYEKVDSELKIMQKILTEQNIMLHRKNSLLQFQINNIAHTNQRASSKLKSINLKSIQRQKNENVETIKIDNSPIPHPEKQAKEYSMARVRGSGDPDSKLKSTVLSQSNYQRASIIPNLSNNNNNNNNNNPFVPNTHQRTFRRTDNLNSKQQLKEMLSNSDKNSLLSNDISNCYGDLPFIRSNSNSQTSHQGRFMNMTPIDQSMQEQLRTLKEVVTESEKRIDKYTYDSNEITRNTTGQKSKTNLFNSNTGARMKQSYGLQKQWLRSQKQSPETKHQTRKGTVKDKQMLLKLLYKREQQNNEQKTISFEEFQNHYQKFLQKTVYEQKENKQQNKLKQIPIYRKGVVSKQRKNELDNSNDLPKTQHPQTQQQKHKQEKKNQQLIKMKNALFIISLDAKELKKLKTEKLVLNMGQMQIMTQIMAYMIQMKVNNDSAYQTVKKLIAVQEIKADTAMNQTFTQGSSQQKRHLKQSLSYIIKIHRKCPKMQKGFNGCSHLQQFINSIATMIQD